MLFDDVCRKSFESGFSRLPVFRWLRWLFVTPSLPDSGFRHFEAETSPPFQIFYLPRSSELLPRNRSIFLAETLDKRTEHRSRLPNLANWREKTAPPKIALGRGEKAEAIAFYAPTSPFLPALRFICGGTLYRAIWQRSVIAGMLISRPIRSHILTKHLPPLPLRGAPPFPIVTSILLKKWNFLNIVATNVTWLDNYATVSPAYDSCFKLLLGFVKSAFHRRPSVVDDRFLKADFPKLYFPRLKRLSNTFRPF